MRHTHAMDGQRTSSVKKLTRMKQCNRPKLKRYLSVLSLFLILGSACYKFITQAAESQAFTVHELTLGGSQCKVEGISDGRAVGWATTPGNVEIHAFAWTELGGMVDLGTLGGTRAEARAVDGTRVVGFSFTAGNAEIHAFSWTPTEGMGDLGTLGGTYGAAFGVSGGEVVGESTTASGEIHAFRWTAVGGMIDLGTLSGGTQSSAFRVHQGIVAGWSTTSGDAIRTRRPVAWNVAGEIIDIVGEPFDLLEWRIRPRERPGRRCTRRDGCRLFPDLDTRPRGARFRLDGGQRQGRPRDPSRRQRELRLGHERRAGGWLLVPLPGRFCPSPF